MSDIFWTQFFGFLGIIAAGVWKHILDRQAAQRLAEGQKQVEQKVVEGNKLTEQVTSDVAKKMDSVTSGAAEATKAAAQKLALDSAKNQEKIVTSVKELATTIKGSDGTCVTGRLEKLEQAVARLEQGHLDISTKFTHMEDRVVDAINKSNSKI